MNSLDATQVGSPAGSSWYVPLWCVAVRLPRSSGCSWCLVSVAVCARALVSYALSRIT